MAASRLSWLKLVLIGLVLLIILAGAALAFALSNLNSLIGAYKPQLETMLSSTLNAKVSLGSVKTQIFPTSQLQIAELKITPRHKTIEEGLSLKNFFVDVSLMPLLQKHLEISKISMDAPHIVMVKNESGTHIVGLEGIQQKNTNRTGSDPASKTESKQASTTAPLEIRLHKVEVTNASITFKDETQKKEYQLENVSFYSSVELEGKATSLSNLKFKGTLHSPEVGKKLPIDLDIPQMNMKDDEVIIDKLALNILSAQFLGSATAHMKQKNGNFDILSNSFDLTILEMLPQLSTKLKEVSLKGVAAPRLKGRFAFDGDFDVDGSIELKDVSLKQKEFAITALNATLELVAQKEKKTLSSKNLNLKVNGAPLAVQFSTELSGSNDLKVPHFQVNGFGGIVDGAFAMQQGNTSPFTADLKVKDLDLSQTLQTLSPASAQKVSGTMRSFAFKGAGVLGSELTQSLKGTGSLEVANGTLKGFNLAGLILKSLNSIPVFGGTLFDSLPPDQRAQVDAPDTNFQSIAGNFIVANSTISTKNLTMLSPVMTLEADGNVGFNAELDLDATILFSQKFSENMIARGKDLKALLDDSARMVIPLTLKGTPPAIVVIPNVKKLLEVSGKNLLKDQATKALEGFLKGKSGKSQKGLEGLFGF